MSLFFSIPSCTAAVLKMPRSDASRSRSRSPPPVLRATPKWGPPHPRAADDPTLELVTTVTGNVQLWFERVNSRGQFTVVCPGTGCGSSFMHVLVVGVKKFDLRCGRCGRKPWLQRMEEIQQGR